MRNIIEIATELIAAVSGPDIVVEAIHENVDAKHEIFPDLDAASDPSTILASNTSSIPIQMMAQVCQQPKVVIGTHFALPAHILPLGEVILHPRISDDCSDRIFRSRFMSGSCPSA